MALTQDSVRVGPLEVQTASAALGDADVSGDQFCVVPTSGGVLVAVIDGLGHGPQAAEASARACHALRAERTGSLTAAIGRCHTALRSTRGAVIALALFCRSATELEWLGVGNVEGLLLRGSAQDGEREAIVQRPGIVGSSLPRLIPSRVPVGVGDTLVLATDGLARELGHALRTGSAAPADGAAGLMRRFATGTDDALLLLARYVGDQQ